MQSGNVSFAHVPREKNQDADRLSNVGNGTTTIAVTLR